ncbi:MAG: hypothetical protein RJA72_1206, partial [Pseudomonadota bacterium]
LLPLVKVFSATISMNHALAVCAHAMNTQAGSLPNASWAEDSTMIETLSPIHES